MADQLEDLLQDALRDLGAEPAATASQTAEPAGSAVTPQEQSTSPETKTEAAQAEPPAASGPTSEVQAATSSEDASKTAPRGPQLPPRQGKGGLAFDPLGGSKPKKTSAPAPAPSKPLPPKVQSLADDLLKLVEEAGIGGSGAEASGSTIPEGLDMPDFDSPALKALMESMAKAAASESVGASDSGGLEGLPGLEELSKAFAAAGLGAGGPGPDAAGLEALFGQGLAGAVGGLGQAAGTSAGVAKAGAAAGGDEEEEYSSATLRALSQKTKRTVAAQSKFTRGEAATSLSAQAAAQQGAGAGGGLFGGLGGLMGMLEGGVAEGGGMNMMVDYIMQNLLSKDVLYGPLKDIRDKYPPWLESNKATLSPEDFERYSNQFISIQAVCKQYEEDPANFGRLVELIQAMQAYGDPPAGIVEDMTGGMAPDLLGGAAAAGAEGEGAGTSGDEDDLGNLQLPPELLKDLPKELQKDCTIM